MIRLAMALIALLTAGPALAAQQPPDPNAGFVPLDQLPPGEQMPAGPLLIAAYAFFLALMMFYLWTIWRRIGKVEEEMRELERRSAAGRATR